MNDYESMNVEDLNDMVSVDHLPTMLDQADGWRLTGELFDEQIRGLKADLETAKKTWKGEAADRYFLEVTNTIASMEHAKQVASGNGTAWKKIYQEADSTRIAVQTEKNKWDAEKTALDEKKSEDKGFQLDDVGEVFGGKGNDVTTEDYNEKRKPFDTAARKAANSHGQVMEDTYLKDLWNPKTTSQYELPPDPGPAPDWEGLPGSGKPGYRPPTGDDGGPVGNGPDSPPPQPPPGHGLPPELQTPPPVGPPPVVTPPPVTPPPVGPPPVVTPPPVIPPPTTGPAPTRPPVVKPPIGRPTPPPPTTKPPVVARPTPPPTMRPPTTTTPPTTGRPPTTTPPAPRPPGRTVQPVIGGRPPTGPTTTGPIANNQRPTPTVRPVSPAVIGQRGPNPTAPVPGIRGNQVAKPAMVPGKAGMDTRGVFGTRMSKMDGMAQSASAGQRGAGVRSASMPMRGGAEGLNRGVIRGAKATAAGGAPMAGGARGTVRRRDEERTATIESDGPLDNLFNVDKTVVPGVIRGWTPPADTDHSAGPALFGERPGKAAGQRKKKVEDEWDDW